MNYLIDLFLMGHRGAFTSPLYSVNSHFSPVEINRDGFFDSNDGKWNIL